MAGARWTGRYMYVLKDDLKHLWSYRYRKSANKFFEGWYERAIESGIPPH